MSAIITQTFGEGIKKGMQIANEEFVRKMVWGNDWNLLRISMLYAVTPNGTSAISGTRLVVGLVNNTIQGRTYNSTNTTNFLGFLVNHTSESTGQALTYNANSGNPFYNQTTSRGAMISRVGNSSTITNFATTGGQPDIPTTTGTTIQRRTISFFDFYRNTTLGSATANWQQQQYDVETVGGISIDVLHEQLYMEQMLAGAGQTSVTGLTNTPLTNSPANPNESANGNLDTVSIFWNQQAFPLEIYELAVFRIR